MFDRRRFLRAFGAGSTATFLAGCTSLGDEDDGTPSETPGDTDTETATPTTTDGEGGTTTADGETTATGGVSGEYETRLVRLTAGGDDLGSRQEQGHFYYDEVSGDFDVRVHAMNVVGSTGWEKAGLMVRESLAADAAHLMVRRNPDGESVFEASPASVQWRAEQGAVNRANETTTAEWLRVRREGDVFAVYGSMTGEEWEQFDEFTTDDVALGEDVLVGLAATGMEEYDDPTTTATFKDLSGFEPAEGVDLGEPDHAGDVTVREDVPVVSTARPDCAPSEMTLAGKLYLPDGVESAEYRFEYRRNDADAWTETETRTVSESGTVTATVPATSRRIYQVRAVADVPGADLEAATPTRGAVAFVSTPSPGDGGSDDTRLSPGVSAFGPADGFADPAPWLDDDTPVITISEPSVDELDRAIKTPHERLVVFETSGTIDLQASEWSIVRDKCYVAGQTAPSPGVTLVRGSFQVARSDCVVQHLRVRAGIAGQEQGYAPTGLHTQDGMENNVIDHCTVTWAIDENLTVGGPSRDTTLTNNLAAEGLANATHPKGNHSYGSLIKDGARNVAMLGNVWAHNRGRNPRLKTGTTSAVVNNVSYDFDEAVNLDADTIASVVGNGYLRGDVGDANVEGGKAHVADNFADFEAPMTRGVTELSYRRIWPGELEPMPSGEVLAHNLANAGARPADRTAHDERVLQQVRDRTGDRIDSEQAVGGYPALPVNTHTLEVPDSGTHAWLRRWSERVESGS